jgi:hypothetical protein
MMMYIIEHCNDNNDNNNDNNDNNNDNNNNDNNNDNNIVIIEILIDSLTKIIIPINQESTKLVKNTDPSHYDQLVYVNQLCYYDQIVYLYNYIITCLYDYSVDDIDIDFDTTYIPNKAYTKYTIFFNDIDTTFDIKELYIGPTLKFFMDIIADKTKYFNINYHNATLLYNVYSLLNYFSKIVDDPIVFSDTYETGLGKLYYIYNNNPDYIFIAGLFQYVYKYSPTISPGISQIILDKINNDPITKILYENMDIFIFILSSISSIYKMIELLDNMYSNIDSKVFLLKLDEYIDPFYTVIRLPYISNFMTDTINSNLSNNSILEYAKGVINYQILNSNFVDFAALFDAQYNLYNNTFVNLSSTNDIGYNTIQYGATFNILTKII